MKLIEKSSPSNIQTFLVSPKEEEGGTIDISVIDLIKANLIQRMLRFMKSRNFPEDRFKEIVRPNLTIRVIKLFNPKLNKPPILVGNLNFPNSVVEDPKMEDLSTELKDNLDAEFPREKFLTERLKELNYSSKDIIRQKDVYSEFLYEEVLSDYTFTTLEKTQEPFYDYLFSNVTVTYRERVKAGYIISLDRLLKSKELDANDFNKEVINRLVEDIDDMETRTYVLDHITRFINKPEQRENMREEAYRIMKMKPKKQGTRKPVPTWKLVAAIAILILGVLAFTNRRSIAEALAISKNSKDFEGANRFDRFQKHLFSKPRRSAAMEVINVEDAGKRALFQKENPKHFENLRESAISKWDLAKIRYNNKFKK